MTERATVFLVDDHDVTRLGTRPILEERFDVVGEADEVNAAIEMILERQPDIVLLDVRLPGGGGAAVIEGVKPASPSIRFLAFSASTSPEDVIALLRAGVDGYVTKATLGVDLPDLIQAALDGLLPMSPEVAGYLLRLDDVTPASGLEKLTPREKQVVRLIARGYTYRETASSLNISVKTLETHMRHIFDKLGVASRNELTARAFETGFMRPEDQDAGGES